MCSFKFQISNAGLASLLLPVILCGGCAKKSEPAPTAADGAMRIVSMAPNLTEILFALGLEDEIAAVTRHCNIPEKARQKPNIGSFWQPDIEAVLAHHPTLVITLDFSQQRQLAERLEKIGCTVLTVEDFESLQQLYDGVLTIGQAVGRQEQAETMVARLKAAAEQMRARYAGREKRKVLWVIQREPLRVAGEKTFINEMIEIVGGVNAVGPTVNVYPPISAEHVIAAWPDVIIEPANMPNQQAVQTRSAEVFYAGFRRIPAVQNRHIYVPDGDLVSRLGPRLDEALALIADCVWGE